MSIVKNLQPKSATQVPEPPLARFLFADTRIAWLWLIVRVYIGWQWLVAGIEKLTGYSIDVGSFGEKTGNSWIFTSHQGAALSGFLNGASPRQVAHTRQYRAGMAGSSSTSRCRWPLDSRML